MDWADDVHRRACTAERGRPPPAAFGKRYCVHGVLTCVAALPALAFTRLARPRPARCRPDAQLRMHLSARTEPRLGARRVRARRGAPAARSCRLHAPARARRRPRRPPRPARRAPAAAPWTAPAAAARHPPVTEGFRRLVHAQSTCIVGLPACARLSRQPSGGCARPAPTPYLRVARRRRGAAALGERGAERPGLAAAAHAHARLRHAQPVPQQRRRVRRAARARASGIERKATPPSSPSSAPRRPCSSD
jgi:hypothetical protein